MTNTSFFAGRYRYAMGAVAALGLVAAALFLAARRPVSVTAAQLMMGTEVSVTVSAKDRKTARVCVADAFRRIEEIEKSLSATMPDSELALVNAHAGGEPVAVSDDLFSAIQAGVAWHEKTGGAFDITVGPLLGLWRDCGKAGRVPTDEELAIARAKVGAQSIELDAARRTVRLPAAGMRIHLGGLGKGFAADRVAAQLRERGIRSAIIRVAGDIYALGQRPDDGLWRVGIQDPRQPESSMALLGILGVADTAVSTSGNYQRFVEIKGKRYSHIVDPRTGQTADNVPSVTVIGPDVLTTDILGTALSVLGIEAGMKLVESLPLVEAMFFTFDEHHVPHFTRSRGFAAYEARDDGEAARR